MERQRNASPSQPVGWATSLWWLDNSIDRQSGIEPLPMMLLITDAVISKASDTTSLADMRPYPRILQVSLN